MNVLVVGAAGKTGKVVVEQALAAGHRVTAFVRRADEYEAGNVRVVEGDATNPTQVDTAVVGQDAVLDMVGGKTPWKSTSLESSIATVIIDSMQRHGVRRFVVVSMIGEGDSKANVPIYERILFSTLLRGTDKDKAAMESAVRSTDLDWIIVRPAILTNGSAKGNIRVFRAEMGQKAHTISRVDLASFMIAQLSNDEHLHQAVAIATD